MPLAGVRIAPSKRTIVWLLATAVLVAACGVPSDLGGTSGPGNSDPNPPGFFPTDPATDQGGHIAALYPIVFFIAVAVFLLVEGLLLLIVFRFRRRATDDTLPAQTHGNNLLEIIWTAIPALIVTVLFVLTVGTLTQVETLDDSPAVEIDVTGFQWQWQFDYPREGLSLTGSGSQGPVMGIPVNETVRIRLHARDVIHAFYVPQFLYKKDAVPGRVNEFDVLVREAGTYTGQCAEFCGFAHAAMFFTVQAMERPDYEAWVQTSQQGQGEATAPPDAFTIDVTALDIRSFDEEALTAPADTPIVFQFQNADPSGAPHDVSIVGGNPDGSDWNGEPDAQGGQSATYVAPALAAGEYEFYCSIHPTTMRGTLTVGNE
ncbi:MAG TPA: cytochrome c oxidase subunit II [Candidatus Caenarcaniphilales bacterium]|nr:cytochrome c oxidase subunit II [Candidatus Caenarcaniphilales bacterium]